MDEKSAREVVSPDAASSVGAESLASRTAVEWVWEWTRKGWLGARVVVAIFWDVGR